MPQALDATRILTDVTGGERSAVDRLFPLVYDELRRLARGHMRNQPSDHTLDATALVHEAYLKLIDQSQIGWENRAHFFAIAARAIRQILTDHARRKGRIKRWGGLRKAPFEESLVISGAAPRTDALAVEEALRRLGRRYPGYERIVEMRFIGGLTNEETAEVLGVSTRTIERRWRFGRAWLYRELLAGDTDPERGTNGV
ncbi:MAG: sigma-70 family RNA polymerase sigma factor [Candidatus Latescibacteria bacterium]|nr:sigma-70 family RNA polymerase sigma factor [Candidatus Latescibacterota bacterium]